MKRCVGSLSSGLSDSRHRRLSTGVMQPETPSGKIAVRLFGLKKKKMSMVSHESQASGTVICNVPLLQEGAVGRSADERGLGPGTCLHLLGRPQPGEAWLLEHLEEKYQHP